MASNIRDIKVNISGDASALKSSLKEVNDELGKTQRDLNYVDKLLKFDPRNVDLLREKQELLTNSISSTKSKLDALKEAKKKADEEGIKNTEKGAETYNTLIHQISATSQKLEQLQNQMNQFGSVTAQRIKGVGDNFQEVGDKIESAGRKVSVFSAAAAGIIGTGVAYNAEMEKYNTALTTLTGSSEKANEIITQIKKDAASTPFDVQGLTKANQLLLSTGLDADEARSTILALGDAISATGGGDAELSRMAVNLQQIKNLGKASSMDIKQFANAGIDIYGLLADYLHISKEEAADMTITWEDLNGALINASQEGGKYFNAMQKQSETFNGKISNLKDNLGQLVGNLTESLMPVINKMVDAIAKLSEWFSNLSPQIQELIATILLIVAALGPAIIIIGKIVSGIGSIMTLAPLITTAITTISTFVTGTLIPAISSLFTLLLANPIGLIIAAVTAIIAGVVLLYNKCDWFRNGVNAIFEWIKNAVMVVVDNVIKFFTVTIPEAFNNFLTFLQTVMQFIVSFITDPIGTIKELLNALLPKALEWAKSMLSKIKDGFSKIKEVGKYIVEGIWNGILNAKDWLLNKIKEFAHTITQGIKDFFGIESPSKVMRDQVGKYLAQGIGVGFDREMNKVISDMTETAHRITEAISTELDVNAMPNVKNSITSQNYYTTKSYQNTTEIVRQPSNVILQVDRTKLGEVVVDAYNQRNKIVGVTL